MLVRRPAAAIRLLYAIATTAMLAGLSSIAAAGVVQNRIYPAPTTPLSLSGLPAGAEIIHVRTADGLDLTGVAVAARPAMPTLLVFHGNASSATGAIAWLAPLLAEGYGIIAAEYRGYSANPGRPDEAGLAADADAFYDLARAKAAGGPVWVVGHSLGGGVALGLAQRHRLDTLVTIGAFTSLRSMAPKLARGFVPDAFDNEAAVAALDEPYFLIHGALDVTVPVKHGEKLHAIAGRAIKQGASFVILDADHRPDGRALAAIFDAIHEKLKVGDFSALPSTIKVIPFGQVGPINP